MALILIACCLFFHSAVALRGVFFHYDHAIQNYPYRHFYAEALKEGRLPLWTSRILCGFPLFAESQSNALYPPFLLLFRFLPPWVAYNYYHVLHFALAGVFTYVLARVLCLGRGAAVLAGIAYMLSGPVLYHAHHTNIVVGVAWLPVLLALIELWVRHRTLAPLLGFAGATAMLALGAQPQYTLYCALACGIYALWRLRLMEIVAETVRQVGVVTVGLMAAGLLGGLLAAVQILPLAELVSHTSRGGFALPGASSGVPANLMTLLLPHYFGSPGLGSYWANFEPGLYTEITMFMGVGTLMLALFGAATDRSRRALFFSGLGIFSFLFSLGFHGSIYNAFGYLPVFRASRFPSRFAFVMALCAALLAGMGLDQLRQSENRERLRRWAFVSAGVVLVVSVACMAVAAVWNAGPASLNRPALAAAFPQLPEFELDVVWRHLHRTLPADLWRLAVVGVGGTVLLVLFAGRAAWSRTATALWCLLLFAELAYVGREFSVVTDPDIYREPPALVRALRRLPPARIFRYRYYGRRPTGGALARMPFTRGWALEPGLYARSLDRVPPNANMLWNLPSVGGFCPLQTAALKSLLGMPHHRGTLIEFGLSRPLDLLGARYILTPRDSLPPGYRLLREVDGIRVFENPNALPRAFIVHRAERLPTGVDAVRVLTDDRFDYREKALIGDSAQPPLDLRPGRAGAREHAEVVQDSDDRLVVEAELDRTGYLVLADQHYPGWSVEVDGTPAELLKVDYLLKGVRLEPGAHRVVFAFRPAAFRVGLAASLVALAVLCTGVALCMLTKARLGTPGAVEDVLVPHGRRSARLLVVAGLVFLLLGPALRPKLWRDTPQQLDPRQYGAAYSLWSAAYDAADGELTDSWNTVREACRWWPESRLLREKFAGLTRRVVRERLLEGKSAEARRIAQAAMETAPREVRPLLPAKLRP
ncbi:MAG: YfhO family protein [Candidatus Brocadiaceae bacterium]